MDPLQGEARRGRGGKLTEVLDHQLRIGEAEVSDKIIAAYKERGLTPPEHLEAPPQVAPAFVVYWEAYQDLQTERRAPRGPIPISAILDYCQAFGLNPDTLKRIVWKVDRVLLDHWKSVDESEKRQAELTRAAKPAIAAGSKT